jgi:hypothetical protein
MEVIEYLDQKIASYLHIPDYWSFTSLFGLLGPASACLSPAPKDNIENTELHLLNSPKKLK